MNALDYEDVDENAVEKDTVFYTVKNTSDDEMEYVGTQIDEKKE